MTPTPGKAWGLRRLADAAGHWRMIATDQRDLIAEPIAKALGVDSAPYEEVSAVVGSLIIELQEQATAVLIEPIYGYLPSISAFDPHKGLMLSYESLQMQDSPGGIRMGPIPDWTVDKIRSLGADAVKLLVLYRHDASEDVRQHQRQFVLDAGEACRRLDIPLLLEILVYRREYESAEEYEAARPELVVKAVRDFVDPRFGVDIYKLEPPGSLSGVPSRATVGGQALSDAYQALTADLTAPWVLLSAGMGKADFRRSLEYAYEHGASGYLAGRAIWAQAAAMYPDHDAIRASLRQESVPFVAELNELTDQRATAWFAHPSVDARDAFGYPVDRAFASHYPKTATPLPGTSS